MNILYIISLCVASALTGGILCFVFVSSCVKEMKLLENGVFKESMPIEECIKDKAEFFDRFICKAYNRLDEGKEELCENLRVSRDLYDEKFLRLLTVPSKPNYFGTNQELLRWKLNEILCEHGYIYTFPIRDPRFSSDCEMCNDIIDCLKRDVRESVRDLEYRKDLICLKGCSEGCGNRGVLKDTVIRNEVEDDLDSLEVADNLIVVHEEDRE